MDTSQHATANGASSRHPPLANGQTNFRRAALVRCDDLIRYYTTYSLRAWRYYTGFQVATLVLAGFTPFLILLGDAVPHALQALPAALAALAAGVNAVFHSREDAIRLRITRELLKSEKAKFETRTSPGYGTDLPDATALDHFVCRIEELTINEVLTWGTLEKESGPSKPVTAGEQPSAAQSQDRAKPLPVVA
jgi:uncharacterized protein DUF4231